jgi:DUF4097 and DUF4098 domain-containing protein YvlB
MQTFRVPTCRPAMAAAVAAAILALPLVAEAQRDPAAATREWMENCDRGGYRDNERHCLVRTQTIPATQRISIDGRQNGGVRVTGWDRNEIHIVARIQGSARTEAAARELASAVTIQVRDGRISADGPEPERSNSWWSASFDVYVPRNIDLDLQAHNGGIAVSDIRGRLEMETTNGGLRLENVSGDVRGRTTNGGVSVALGGERWQGSGLDVRTTNGGVTLRMPERYSARLETSTVNGSMRIDFPVTVQGRIGRQISTDIGGGGPPIRVSTTNGGVSIRRS